MRTAIVLPIAIAACAGNAAPPAAPRVPEPVSSVAASPPVPAAEADRDRDSIPDICDCCPDEPENFNGIEDEDGCPDGCRMQVGNPLIDHLAPVAWFEGELRAAAIESGAAILKDPAGGIEAAMCIGQAAASEREPDRVSAARAKRACDALIALGVDARILQSAGVGTRELRVIPGAYVDPPRAMTIVQVTRAKGKVVWRWTGSSLVEGERMPERKPAKPCCPGK